MMKCTLSDFKHFWRLTGTLVLLGLMLSACLPISRLPDATPIPSATPPSQLGEERHNETGGFTYRPPAGYRTATDGSVVTMLALGADPQLGPSLTLYAGAPDPGATAQSLLDQLKGAEDTRLGEPQAVQIGGYAGLIADIVLVQENVELYGRIATLVTPETQFIALAVAPQTLWQTELAPALDAVLSSVTFFPRVVPTEASVPPVETPTPSP
jgi:hypothetical protein